jgi:putative PEP-CTERM system histidine kinase
VAGWQQWRMGATALVPGSWLLFSLIFGRAHPARLVGRWLWFIAAAFVVPVGLLALGRSSVFTEIGAGGGRVLLRLGWAGYALYLVLLLSAVVVLMNLERTLRATVGTMRWNMKFMVLGVGGLFAVRIYTSSQALLFHGVDTSLQLLNAGALIVAVVLVAVSFGRAHLLAADIYVSQSLLYNSLTVLVVGVYLLAVGLVAKTVSSVGGASALPLVSLLVFVSVLGLAVILLSDRVRGRAKRLVDRNLRRPRYDYRKEWMAFARRTSSAVEIRDFCAGAATSVSETFGTPSVTIWLLDEGGERLRPGGSTLYSQADVRKLAADETQAVYLPRLMGERLEPLILDPRADRSSPPPAYMDEVRLVMALVAGRERLGFLTLGRRVPNEPFSAEDFELLKTIADQAAAGLLNLRLSERLLRAKEREAFEALSAFFVHDLKNLASKLSLTLQNLPQHYDDPAFRSDLLAVISRSVDKINAMCGRLSPLSQKLELLSREADLNDVVRGAVAGLPPGLRAELKLDLAPLPRLVLDPEQVQKVLTNLLLNAGEAVGAHGEIRVTTGVRDAWAVISVIDNGCGMSKEYVAQSLFQPFRTTKKQGLGIGLFHSKAIVEGHHGRIEVESEERRGTTFRVLLPLAGAKAAAGSRPPAA